MNLKEAINLLSYSSNKKQTWADLGCGTGTFTLALAHQLKEESTIYAVDKNSSALNKIPDTYNKTNIKKHHSDFTSFQLPEKLNGILMANSLHYVSNKAEFIKSTSGYLKDDGCFLIIEYDTEASNQWVPFPISFQSLKVLFNKLGFSSIIKLNEHPSIYRRANMYSAIIKK